MNKIDFPRLKLRIITGIVFAGVYLGMLRVVSIARFPCSHFRGSDDYFSSFEFFGFLERIFMSPHALLPPALGYSASAFISLGISAAIVVGVLLLSWRLLTSFYRLAVHSLSPS